MRRVDLFSNREESKFVCEDVTSVVLAIHVVLTLQKLPHVIGSVTHNVVRGSL